MRKLALPLHSAAFMQKYLTRTIHYNSTYKDGIKLKTVNKQL
jgi:hypothetical protein